LSVTSPGLIKPAAPDRRRTGIHCCSIRENGTSLAFAADASPDGRSVRANHESTRRCRLANTAAIAEPDRTGNSSPQRPGGSESAEAPIGDACQRLRLRLTSLAVNEGPGFAGPTAVNRAFQHSEYLPRLMRKRKNTLEALQSSASAASSAARRAEAETYVGLPFNQGSRRTFAGRPPRLAT
jgi:hypothetical protein